MKTVSIGFHRPDGDFAILATLNNIDGCMSYVDFKQLIDDVGHTLCRKLMCQIDVIDHEDVIT